MASHQFIIVDDHPLFRGALRLALAAPFPDAGIVEASTLDELVAILEDGAETDVVLLDLAMPGVQGFSGLLLLRAQYPSIPVIIVSASEDPATIRRAMNFGAAGFVPKSQPVEGIRKAVETVLAGDVWIPPKLDLPTASESEDRDLAARLATLTPQQVRVLMMLGDGLLNKQIAYKLNVSEATIKAHVSAILQKLGVDSRTQAVIAIGRLGTDDWRRGDGPA